MFPISLIKIIVGTSGILTMNPRDESATQLLSFSSNLPLIYPNKP